MHTLQKTPLYEKEGIDDMQQLFYHDFPYRYHSLTPTSIFKAALHQKPLFDYFTLHQI
nr:hypothetical protein P5627_13020 [Bacillus safensis]